MTRIPENTKIRPSVHEPKFGNRNDNCRDNYAEAAKFSLNFFFMNTVLLNVCFDINKGFLALNFTDICINALFLEKTPHLLGITLLLTEP